MALKTADSMLDIGSLACYISCGVCGIVKSTDLPFGFKVQRWWRRGRGQILTSAILQSRYLMSVERWF